MKEEKTSGEQKVVSFSHSATPPSRVRPSPAKPTKETPTAGLKTRSRSVSVPPQDPINTLRVRRSLGLNKPKSGEVVAMGSQKGRETEEVKALGRSGTRPLGDQLARPRRRGDDLVGEKKELQERLSSSENLVKELQSEVVELKSQLEILQNLNVELVSRNQQFADDLAAAQEKISVLSTQGQSETAVGKPQTSNFKDVQKLIASKLESLGVNKNGTREGSSNKMSSPMVPKSVVKVSAVQPPKVQASSPPPSAMPPPPPPPPLPRVPSRAPTAKKAPSLVEFYHTLTKREGKKDAQGPSIRSNQMTNNAHNSIVGEIQNRSSHLLAIKLDVETKGEFIKSLIEKIQTAAYADIEDVLKFVDWIDSELSTLADERAVLKHFNWPEKKADAMREAAIEYRDLRRLECEISSCKDDSSLPCEAALRKIAGLLDKSERSIQRIIKLRHSTMISYRDCKIPIDWMLDSGMVHKIKQASMKLAKIYMERVSMELQSVRNSERESTQEALLLQGVRFAYRAHQFAGGLDSETMCAFEEIRQRIPLNMGGSRELMAGIAS